MIAINDRCTIDRDGRRPMVRSINRCILRPIVRSIVSTCNRSYAWHNVTERTVNRGTRRPMVRINHGGQISIARSIVASCDRSYDQSLQHTTDRTINRGTSLIWNRRLEVLNMTFDLATTDFALPIIHDLCDQSFVLSMICSRFQHFSVAGMS